MALLPSACGASASSIFSHRPPAYIERRWHGVGGVQRGDLQLPGTTGGIVTPGSSVFHGQRYRNPGSSVRRGGRPGTFRSSGHVRLRDLGQPARAGAVGSGSLREETAVLCRPARRAVFRQRDQEPAAAGIVPATGRRSPAPLSPVRLHSTSSEHLSGHPQGRPRADGWLYEEGGGVQQGRYWQSTGASGEGLRKTPANRTWRPRSVASSMSRCAYAWSQTCRSARS